MYGFEDRYINNGMIIRNEIALQNLIMIASNKELLDSLEQQTRNDLMTIIELYTKKNVEAIKKEVSQSYKEDNDGFSL